MAWRLAHSLITLRNQVNRHAPNRNKASDGTIGDRAHQKTVSDHNPNKVGVVTALDITHDPRQGVDTYRLAEHLRTRRDNRIKYVISNGRIFSQTVAPWTWRRYTGSNPHSTHIHVSVVSHQGGYDEASQWDIGLGSADAGYRPAAPVLPGRPTLRQGSSGEAVRTVQRILMLEAIDGIFGPQTHREVTKFQTRENLQADGVVGPLTWSALDSIEQLPRPLDFDDPQELSEPLSEDAPDEGPEDFEEIPF